MIDLNKVGETALKAGKASLNAGKGMANTAASIGLPMIGGALMTKGSFTPGGGYASKAIGLGRSLVKFDENYNNLLGAKVTKLGVAAFAATTVVDGSLKAYRNYNQRRQGVVDNHITRATPQIPSYDLNAGATGDLVFAMNANRRG